MLTTTAHLLTQSFLLKKRAQNSNLNILDQPLFKKVKISDEKANTNLTGLKLLLKNLSEMEKNSDQKM